MGARPALPGVEGLMNASSNHSAPFDEKMMAALATELYRAMDAGKPGGGQHSPASPGTMQDLLPAPSYDTPSLTGRPVMERQAMGLVSAAPTVGTTMTTAPGLPSYDAALQAGQPHAQPQVKSPSSMQSAEASGYYFLDAAPRAYGGGQLQENLYCPTNLLDAGLRASFPDLQPRAPISAPASAAPAQPTTLPYWQDSPFVRTDGVADGAQPAFDVYSIRRDFPILDQRVNGKPLVWMDNGATTQKPRAVIDAISRFYERDNSNIHRGAHALAARATDAYEHAREVMRRFLRAESAREIVFVRGTTEAINLIAQSFGRANVQSDDEIVVTTLEHHANIVPWQMLANEKGAKLRVVPITDGGEVMLEEYARLLTPRTKIVALAHVSNTLGTVLPIEIMTQMARTVGAAVVIDGAQAVAHLPVNVKAIDCDFYVFSGHKIFGPTGVGVMYGKLSQLERMPPWQGGGNMIDTVTFEKTTYSPVPAKFEAGTGILAGAVGLGAAIEYLERIGFEQAAAHESSLVQYGMAGLAGIPGLRLFGTAPHKASTLSFAIEGVDNAEIGKILNEEGIAIRVGHHCAQPTMALFGVTSMARPSLALYNTREEIDLLLQVIQRIASRSHRLR